MSSKRSFILKQNVLRLAVATAVALLPGIANAIVVPAPIYSAILSVNDFEQAQFGTTTGVYSLGSMSLSINGVGNTLQAHSFGVYGPGANELSGGIIYSYAINGPTLGVLVPMWATFTLKAEAYGGAYGLIPVEASAFLGIQGATAATSFNRGLIEQNGGGNLPDIHETLPFAQYAGQLAKVTMSVALSVDGNSGGSLVTAFAYADPYLFIDPTWLLDHPGYSVEVSAGIGNNAPGAVGDPGTPGVSVPEPASFALLSLGLFGLGWSQRKKASS